MKKLFIVLVMCLLAHDSLAKDNSFSCNTLYNENGMIIIRCENTEVICYTYTSKYSTNPGSLQCKFK